MVLRRRRVARRVLRLARATVFLLVEGLEIGITESISPTFFRVEVLRLGAALLTVLRLVVARFRLVVAFRFLRPSPALLEE